MKPSPEAWNSLSKRLDENENASSNKTYWWLGIAAGFIGILFTVSLFFKTNEVVPVIVNNPVKTVEEVQKDTLKNDVKKAVKPVEEFMEIKQNAILPKQEEPIEIVQEQPIITEEEQNANNQIKKELSFEDQKVKEVIAKVNDLMTQNKEVTDDDIEALLLEAQRGINKQRIINQSTGVVDADALLQDVETELDQSFRSKVFEAIKTSFGTVKTAVAQRNQ
ncbi:hypothetical protein GCM10023163_18820 [Aestuariibaculum suncheonense]